MQDDTRNQIGRIWAEVSRLSAENVRQEERLISTREILAEREKQLRAAFASSEKAIEKAENAQLRVNQTQNEFRGALDDAAQVSEKRLGIFVQRSELDAVKDRVQALERGGSQNQGRGIGMDKAQDILLRVLPLLVSLFALYMIYKK
jgi:hypothetical protein